MKTRNATVAAAFALAAAWVAAGRAQQQPTFRSSVDLVTIDVSVFDNDRRPIRGLSANDFTVLEDGKPLSITNFKAIDLPDRLSYPASWMREIAPDVVFNGSEAERVVVLFLDDYNVAMEVEERPAKMLTAKRVAHALIDQLGPADVAAVVYAFNHENGQNFTNDRTRLHAAVDRFVANAPPLGCPNSRCVHTAFRAIAEALQADFPGRRKAIAYISPEGKYQLGPRNVEYGSVEAFEANAAIFDSEPDLALTFRALQAANATVYQYDPRGLKDSLDLMGGGIGMFADHTGGRTVTRTNEPWLRVHEMFEENDSYYMLGFVPAPPRPDGGMHRIQVKVVRPGVEVRARSGYYDGGGISPLASEAVRRRQKPAPSSAIDKAMESTLPTGELPMSLTVAPFATGPLGAALVVVAGLDRPASMPEKDVLELAARAFEENTMLRRSNGVATARIQISRRPAASGMVHYDLATRIDVVPSRYEVRLAMTSSATKLAGSGFTSVVVPHFSRDPLTLSGVVLGRLPAATPATGSRLSGLLPFTPTTQRAFSSGDRIGGLVRVYRAGRNAPGEVQLRTQIVDGRDRTLVDQTETLTPDARLSPKGTSEHRLELPLANIEPGDYLLTIEASAGKLTQTRHVRFKIE